MNDATSDPAQAERLTCALGRGVVEASSALPRSIQQLIFEQAVLAGITASATNRCASSLPPFSTRGIPRPHSRTA